MELLGFGWTEILVAFGATAAALIALHLVRLKRRVVQVPSLAFFAEALPDERSHRSFARLRNLLLLLLLLVAAACIALALGLPELHAERTWGAGEQPSDDIVLLMDATASMQAVHDGRARFEDARRGALRAVDALPRGARVLLMQIGTRPQVVLAWTTDRDALHAAITAMAPTEAAGTAQPALFWATSTCNQRVACRVMLFTDGGLEGIDAALASARDEGTSIEVVTSPSPALDNAAIAAFSARRFPADPTRAEVLVDVANYGAWPYQGTLTLAAEGVVLHRETLAIAPGEHASRSFDRITGADALLTAHIERVDGDALALDDTAYARIPPRRRRHLTLIGTGHAYLDAALLLDAYLEVRALSPTEFEAARERGELNEDDVWLFDGYTPVDAPTKPSFLLHPSSASWLEVGAPISRPHFEEQERTHPLLRYIALGDVNIAEANPVVPREGQDAVLAGESRGALLVRGERDDVPFVALAFDVRASDFALRIGWPIFLQQAIAHLSPDDVRVTEGAQVGTTISLPWTSQDAPALTFVSGAESHAVQGIRHADEAVFTLSRIGAYRAPNGALVIANLCSASESSLRAVSPTEASEEPPSMPEEHATEWLQDVHFGSLLVVFAFALLVLEWFVLHRDRRAQ